MRKLIYLFCLVAMGFTAQAQQDAQFTQYMFNTLYWNPATAGKDFHHGEFMAIHRSQWLGYSSTFDDGSAPTTQSMTLSMPFPRKETATDESYGGFGITLVHDQTGLFRNIEAQLSLAFHKELKGGTLSFGIGSGVYNQSIDSDKLRFVDPDDPIIDQGGSLSDMKADLSAGIFFNSTRYFAGIGASGLLGSEFDFNPNSDLTASALAIHMNFMGGYHFEVNNNWKVSPSTIVKFAEKDNISYEVSLLATYNDGEFDRYYGGIAYRDSEGPSALAGIYLGKQKQFRLGYAFDLVVQGQNAKERTSHEIMLSYRLRPILTKLPGVIHTPRFKHF